MHRRLSARTAELLSKQCGAQVDVCVGARAKEMLGVVADDAVGTTSAAAGAPLPSEL